MNRNIIFIGGIHGAGKGTLCANIAKNQDIIHLSASALIRWSDINIDQTNKKVENIQDTQDRLIVGLNNVITPDHVYLLDGHFCLLSQNGNIENVPTDIFKQINPRGILLVECDPVVICRRLYERDAKEYSVDLIRTMQEHEIERGKEIAQILNIKYQQILFDNFSLAAKFISSCLQ